MKTMRLNAILLSGLLALATAAAISACGGSNGRADAGPDADGMDADADGGGDDGDLEIDGDSGDGDTGPVELTVTGVLPSRGPVQGGTWANIIGSGFVNGIGESPFDVRDVTDVWFGDNAAIDIEVIRDDMISVRTPPGVAGATEVIVDNPNGRIGLPDAFDYYEAVRVDSFGPTDFSAAGGTPFAATGTGFTDETSVLIAGRPAAGVVVASAERLDGLAPPGAPGSADVQVVNRNGDVLLFRAARYHPVPALDGLAPALGPAAGATQVSAAGQGLEDEVGLLFDGAEATDVTVVGPTELQAQSPPGLPGPVDVILRGVVESDLLPGGFVYLDASTGSLRLLGIAPGAGPTSGGQSVTLAGDGFTNEPISAVLFGGVAATDVNVIDDRTLQASVPAGAPGEVAVEVETANASAALETGYRYFEPLQLTSIDPVEGQAAGQTPFSLTGDGFGPQTVVRFGGVEATGVQVVSASALTGLTPPGAVGVVDVSVTDSDSRAVLEGAFSFTTDLVLVRVDPDNGSQAGGTYVTLYGAGFGPGMQIWFGDKQASLVQVLSPSKVTARTPKAEPGEVTVAVELGDERAELPAGYSYVDPTNDRGGASGGAIQGSLNVTCLDGSYTNYGAPVPAATVVLSSPALSGQTDARGQVTFSGPSLVREVTVTVGKEGFEAITVVGLNAANLTVYLFPNEQEPTDPGQFTPTYSAIEGRVFGFKDVPGLPTGPTISYEARVNLTSYSIYSVPPYGGAPRGTPILADGDPYSFSPLRLGDYSVYALYGAFDTETEVFTPGLLGLRRRIILEDEDPASGQDVVLSTPLDQAVMVHLIDPPLGDGEQEVEYGAYVSLDLGSDGIIYLSQVKGTGSELVLTGLPEAAGDAFLFVGLATEGNSYPYSYVFRRQEGSLEAGLNMGPFLGFTRLTDPLPDSELTDGRLAWAYDGPAPELTQVLIQTSDLSPKTLWRLVVPGEVTEVQLPAELLDLLPAGEPLLMLLYTANSPRFTFDRFNYGQLSSGRWTAYTVNFTSFVAP